MWRPYKPNVTDKFEVLRRFAQYQMHKPASKSPPARKKRNLNFEFDNRRNSELNFTQRKFKSNNQ